MQSPRLPWEVIERVIAHSRDDPRSLRSFSLICRQLLPRSRCLMLAAGVKLKSRDHAFALVDYLQNNPRMNPFIGSITVNHSDFPPCPLLQMLSALSQITFTMTELPNTVPYFHPSTLTCFQRFGSNIQVLHLFGVSFPTSLAFAQLLLAFSSIVHLVCENVDIRTGGNHAPLAVVKQRLSERLKLRSLVIDSCQCGVNNLGHRSHVANVLLDLNLKLAWSTVERFEIQFFEVDPYFTPHLVLSQWSQLKSLVLHFLDIKCQLSNQIPVAMGNVVSLLENLNGTSVSGQDVTIHFGTMLHWGRVIEYLQSNPSKRAQLERSLLRFSKVNLIWSTNPLQATRNLFWTQEVKKHFPMLFQRPSTTLVWKSETVYPASHDAPISVFVASPDSKWIASGSNDSTVILWDTQDGSIAQQWAFPGYHALCSLVFSPDSLYLVGGSNNGKGALWDLSDGARLVATIEGHTKEVSRCAWSPDGTIIATASSDAPIRLWDAHTFQALEHSLLKVEEDVHVGCKFHEGPSTFDVAFSPDGHWLISWCSLDSCCNIWDVHKRTLHKVIHPRQNSRRDSNSISPILFDSESKLLLTTVGNSRVEVWDIKMDKISFASPHELKIEAASFSPDGKLILAALEEGVVKVWDIDSGVEILEFKGYGAESISRRYHVAQFSPCGKYIASAGDDSRVRLWRISDGTCVAEFSEYTLEDWVTHIAFSPDGRSLSSASYEGTVVIRRLSDISPVLEQNT